MRAENNETYHLLYNHQGSLRAVVDTNGTIVKEVQYDAFGNITLDTNSALHVSFGFAGGLYDEDTKLTRFGYRDYDAQTGKWMAKDPIGFQGGDTNLYGYVLGDPVNFVDPWGLFQFGKRPLSGMSNTYSLGSMNIGLLHEHGFFDNGANVGFFPTGIGGDSPVNLDAYTMFGPHYDDNIMLQALINLLSSGRWLADGQLCSGNQTAGRTKSGKTTSDSCDYDLLPRNCQDFADALRAEYKRLGGKTW